MIKAIETSYKGYRFRSRLEARWAVFFDALGLEWDYELEGFDLGAPHGYYLPDFFIKGNSHYGPWIEIKGTEPTGAEIDKLDVLCESHGAYGLIIWGTPGEEEFYAVHKEGGIYDGTDIGNPLSEFLYLWNAPTEFIDSAYAKSRAARFEHGACG